MSTATIIVAIVILLGGLVSYAFVLQTVKSKNEQKKRLTIGLKARSRNLKYLLNGFPPGFLSKELHTLVQKNLVDVCEQLSKLEPDEAQHLQELQYVSSQLAEIQRQAAPSAPPALNNPGQIKEVKACLEELHKFVVRLEERQSLSKGLAQVYRGQIKDLVLRVAVDSYYMNGSQSQQGGKTKLAIHYFDLTLNLIIREGKVAMFQAKVEKLRQLIAELKVKLEEEEQLAAQAPEEPADNEEEQTEWDKMSAAEDSWKKKNVYD